MKLVINYDLIKKIEQAKEDFGISIVLQKNLKKVSGWYGVYILMNLSSGQPLDKALTNATLSASLLFSMFLALDTIKYRYVGDIDKLKALSDLRKLSRQLKDLNISTSAELLLEAEAYETKYNIKMEDQKLPYILQEKYIMVPTYNNGEIKDTSILQEHVIGSKVYILSHGSPAKVFKPAFAGR